MKQAVIRLNWHTKMLVPTKDLSKVLAVLENVTFVESTYVGDDLAYYAVHPEMGVDLLDDNTPVHPSVATVRVMQKEVEAARAAAKAAAIAAEDTEGEEVSE